MNTDTDAIYIDCGKHGKRIASIICCHLVKSEGDRCGFIENSSEPNDLQAWCFKCETVFDEEGGMTEKFRAFNNMAVVCVDCYEKSADYHDIAG